tara:strand:- start:283 stop:843 length:561 start_codon:yes stop_codon:yes gene_type:complete
MDKKPKKPIKFKVVKPKKEPEKPKKKKPIKFKVVKKKEEEKPKPKMSATAKTNEKPKKKIKFKVVKKKEEQKTKFSDLDEVSVKRYADGSKRRGGGSNVYIDNKTGKVYDNEKDFNKDEYAGDIVTIKRPGQSDMKGIRIFNSGAKPDLIFGKDFDLSYPYDYNFVDFRSYSVKKKGFKNIPAVRD